MIRWRSHPPVAYPIELSGTGVAARDATNLQSAVDLASATGRELHLYDTFRMRFDVSAPYFYAYSDPTRPIYPAVKITSGNLRIVGHGARILWELPANAPAPGPEDEDDPFLTTSPNAVYVGFCTPDTDYARAIENISITGITFDFLDDQGAFPSFVQSVWMVGVFNVSVTNCVFTATPVTQAVTITADGSNNAVVTWPNNRMVNGKSCLWAVSGSLPPEMALGAEFYGQNHTDTILNLSENDQGALLTITPGTYACTVNAVRFNARGWHFDNCDKVLDQNNRYEFGRQGAIYNICRGVKILDNQYHQLGEGVDNDQGLDGFIVDNCEFTSMWGEAQPLDFSPARNGIISNIRCNKTRTPLQLYAKIGSTTAGWPWLRKHKYYRAVTATVASPGTVRLAGAVLSELTQFWMEIRQNNTGASMPTGTFEFTNYYARNVVGDTCNLSLVSDGPTGALVNITGAAVLPGGRFLRAQVVADSTTVLPSTNVLVDGLTVTNTRDNLRDLLRIGTLRQARAGQDRLQFESNSPLPSNIRLRNINMQGGSSFHIYECDGIDIDGLRLESQTPGTDAGTGAALVVAQSLNDTVATGRSLVKAKLRNIEIVNSVGMGISVQGATDLDMDRIKVDGWNSQASDNTYQAIQVSRTKMKAGTYRIGNNITAKNGTAGSTRAARRFQMLNSGSDAAAKEIHIASPFSFPGATVAGTGFVCDMGDQVASPRRVFGLGMVNTAGGTQTLTLLTNSHKTYMRVLYVSVFSPAAITLNATDFTTAQAKKTVFGTLTNVSAPAINIESVARSAGDEISLGVDGSADISVIPPGGTLQIQFVKGGAGSSREFIAQVSFVEFTA